MSDPTRRQDKAWLLWFLRTRRREVDALLQMSGLMPDVTPESLAHFDRLIDLVKEIKP